MSPTHSRHLRMVGRSEPRLFEITIGKPKGLRHCIDGKQRLGIVPPYMPESLREPLHPGGNSLCYALQIATLMGAGTIYLMGFTLLSGSRYFFGGKNPVLNRPAIYDSERSLHWLRWFESCYPGKALLVPGWDGPLNQVFQHADLKRMLEERRGGAEVE